MSAANSDQNAIDDVNKNVYENMVQVQLSMSNFYKMLVERSSEARKRPELLIPLEELK